MAEGIQTDVGMKLQEIMRSLGRLERKTDRVASRRFGGRGEVSADSPIGIRAALKQKLIKRVFGNYFGSAIIRKSEKKRMADELKLERQDDLEHQRNLKDINKEPSSEFKTIKQLMVAKIASLSKSVSKIMEAVFAIKLKTNKIESIAGAIAKRISPRDVKVPGAAEGDPNKTIRYDPLAPEGFQHTEISDSGKVVRIASKKDRSRASIAIGRQMSSEAAIQTSSPPTTSRKATAAEGAIQTGGGDEYARERQQIAKSEKIDIAQKKEDKYLPHFIKIEKDLQEIKDKLDNRGGFLEKLLMGAGIFSLLKGLINGGVGSILEVVGGIAAAMGLKKLATYAGSKIVKDLEKPLPSNRKTPTTPIPPERPETTRVPHETPEGKVTTKASKGVGRQISTRWKLFLRYLERKSPMLFRTFMKRIGGALAGLAIPGPGWIWTAVELGLGILTAYEIYDLYMEWSNNNNESQPRERLEEDSTTLETKKDGSIDPENLRIQQKTGTTSASARSIAPQRAQIDQTKPDNRGATLNRGSSGLKEIQMQRVQQAAIPPNIVVSQPVNVMQGQGNQNVVIRSRNGEQSLSTYQASIFDHPVTHPGNFML